MASSAIRPGPCKSLGATGCTATGSAACCVGQALTCAIASGTSTGTCAKRPTLAAAPITSVGFGVASGAVTATVRLAAAPVANNNYAGALLQPGTCCYLVQMGTCET